MASKDTGSNSGDSDNELISGSSKAQDISDAADKHVNPEEEMYIKDGIGYINDKADDCEQFYAPSTRNDVASCIVRREGWTDKEMYGKWMAFKYFGELDEAWRELVTAMKENRLRNCWVAKCSTLYYNPSRTGPGPVTTGVITVHTSEKDVKEVGNIFIKIVKQDIKYMLNPSTINDKFKGRKVKLRNLYYNHGSPTYQNPKSPQDDSDKTDNWNINEVMNPEYFSLDQKFSWWILTLEKEELTKLWHIIKQKIMDGTIEAFKMVCPKSPKKKKKPLEDKKPELHIHAGEDQHKSVGKPSEDKKPELHVHAVEDKLKSVEKPSEDKKPQFHVYAVEDKLKSVGMELIAIVCRDIQLDRDGDCELTTLNWRECQ